MVLKNLVDKFKITEVRMRFLPSQEL